MATDLERLIVTLEAQMKAYEREMRRIRGETDSQLTRIDNRFQKTEGMIANFGQNAAKGFLGAVAGGLALDQVIRSIRTSIGEIDDLGDLAERVGMSTDALQALRHTLGQAGGDAAMADRALDKFSDTVAEAALGSGYLAKVFAANNVALRESTGQLRTNEALLADFARLVANAGSAQERLKLATDAFGRQAGPKMVGTLLEIAEVGMPALITRAKELGVVLDQEAIAKAGELDRAFRKVEERIATAYKSAVVTWGGPALLSALAGVEMAFKNIALAAELISLGRVREAVGIITRYEAAKQRIAIGGGSQMTPDDAGAFYDAVGIKQPLKVTVNAGRRTVLPSQETAERRSQIESTIAAMQRSNELLQAEVDTLGMGNRERERAIALAKAAAAARQEGRELTAAEREQVLQLADAHSRLEEIMKRARDVQEGIRELGSAMADAFKSATLEGEKLSDVVENLSKRLASRAIDQLFNIGFNAIANSLVAGMGGPGGGVLPGGIPLGRGIGSRAGGGSWAGGLTWVGERGRELINLPRGSQVIPNDVARTVGRGMSVAFSPTTHIDARGADAGVEERLRVVLAENNRLMMRQVKAALPGWSQRQSALGKI